MKVRALVAYEAHWIRRVQDLKRAHLPNGTDQDIAVYKADLVIWFCVLDQSAPEALTVDGAQLTSNAFPKPTPLMLYDRHRLKIPFYQNH
jgi:hypothetical protein